MERRDMTEREFLEALERREWYPVEASSYVSAFIGGTERWIDRAKCGETRREQLAFIIKRFGQHESDYLKTLEAER